MEPKWTCARVVGPRTFDAEGDRARGPRFDAARAQKIALESEGGFMANRVVVGLDGEAVTEVGATPGRDVAAVVGLGCWGVWRTVWKRRAVERREREAIDRALARLAASEPRWYASFFDRALLAMPAARNAISARDATGLARAWTEQFRYRDPRRRERDVACVRPVADAFLGWVDEQRDERTTDRGR